MSPKLDAPLAALALHPTIEALLVEAGCKTIHDVLALPIPKLMDCGLSFEELAEIVQQIELKESSSRR